MNAEVATLDFETRSCVDLEACGGWKYSLDATTSPLCMAFHLPQWRPDDVELWHPALPQINRPERLDRLYDLFEWVLAGGLIEAHNVAFEYAIWHNIMMPRFGWLSVDDHQWRCSAAKASALALPRGLDNLASALHVPMAKDAEGYKVMMKMNKPRKPRKKERETWAAAHGAEPHPTVWWETEPLFDRLFAYCQQDVRVEAACSRRMPDLSPDEQTIFYLDQTINLRGFRLDRAAIGRALDLMGEETTRLNGQLATLTDGMVERATQRTRLLNWFASQNFELFDTQAQTITETLTSRRPAPEGDVKTALEILQELGRSSTAKYETMQDWISPDDRVRGGLLYHGASTGRWSGKGIQPHNFPKGTIKKWDMVEGWQFLLSKSKDEIVARWGSVSAPLSQALRGTIIASPGKQLFVADYASIEARVLLWVAEDEDGLDVFRRREDPYCAMATDIYKFPVNKHDHPQERQLGKAAVLGLGYQMGASKFVDSAATYGVTIDETFSQTVVDAFREKFWRVKNLWWDQHEAAQQACAEQTTVQCGRIVWEGHRERTYCVLPSGRRLSYPEAEVRDRETPWGEMRSAFTYKGVDPYTHQWRRQTSYGGLLVENIVQAISRDIMAEAMIRCEQSGVYLPILSVHDEIVSEAHPVVGNLQEFEALVRQCPVWATGLPVEAEGWTGERYHK